ncbi:LysR substrate-binding domain-containing protein, partial [Rahnella aceris]|uniref:LysR substrate-binding domain-containing protein n=1 Tax=Rahnella sp. (strain Y9602) TaxID=2703885 RepID=UPI003BA15C50
MGEQRLIICASEGYLERAGTPIDLRELSSHRCISGLPSDGQTYWLIRGKEGHVVRHVVSSAYRFNNGQAMLEAAIAGCGVT